MEQMEKSCHDKNTNLLNTIFLKYQHLLHNHTSDVKGVDEKINAELEKLREDNMHKQFQLEEQSKCLQLREDELTKKERQIHNEKKKLMLKKSVHKRLSFFKQLVNECYSSRKEVESIKREINMLYKRRAKLEEKLSAKSFEKLQIEIAELESGLRVIEDDDDLQEKLNDMQSEVIETGEELEMTKIMANYNALQALENNVELQEARQELINGLKTYATCSHIRVKSMSILDTTPFFVGCSSKDKTRRMTLPLSQLTLSRSLVGDPNWHPFKLIETRSEKREILDEEDEKIVKLKEVCSKKQYHAIVTVLNELKEYKSSGGKHSVLELWNYGKKRKASLKEGIEYILKEWKILKRRKV